MQIVLEGKVALVTGAGRNLGRSIAEALGAAGAHVACAYVRDEAAATEVAEGIIAGGSKAMAVQLDASDPDQIASAVATVSSELGAPDVLINNAAIRPRTKIRHVTVDEWDAVHATNLRGPFLLAQATLEHMVGKSWGRIINIGGIDAYKGSVQRPHVVSSKLGLVGLTRALANEVARFGVTVNIVIPGLINTPRYRHGSDDISKIWEEGVKDIPMAELGTAEDVAAAVMYLVSPQARYVTGQELFVTGGAPPLVRHRAREEDF